MAVSYTLRYRSAAVDARAIPAGSYVELSGLTSTSQAVTGLSAGIEYEVEVFAVSDGGLQSSPVSGGRWTVCPEPDAPSGVPAGHQLTAGTDTNGALDVTWASVTGAASYIVSHRPADGSWNDVPGLIGTSTRLSGLAGSTTHEVRISAVNADGDASSPSSASTGLSATVASGGTVTTFEGDGTIGSVGTRYIVHTFASSGALALHAARDVEYLIVAGGGGGGGSFHGGGGGAGGLITGSLSVAPGSQSAVVGTGGDGGAQQTNPRDFGDNGGDSSVLGVTALGGGGGGAGAIGATAAIGRSGGSGGGGAFAGTSGADGSPGQGHAGGRGRDASGPVRNGGGGGGAGAAGGAAVAGAVGHGGDGGVGVSSAITGDVRTYAGGGGGNGHTSGGRAGLGGAGGGGAGQRVSVAAVAGAHGLGGGGGGADAGVGADGGDGVVIVRYPLDP